MKRLVKGAWRFINKYPWIGGIPLTPAVLALLCFCVYAWKQCGPEDLPPDTVVFLNAGFRIIFLALKISLGLAFALPLVFLCLWRFDKLEESLPVLGLPLLFFVPALIVVLPMSLLVYEKLNPDEVKSWTVQCANIDDPALEGHREKAVALLPRGATDIYISCDPGCFVGGSSDFFRCKISPGDLLAFIKKEGYNFRFDSTQVNENSKYPQGHPGWPNADGTSLSGSKCFRGLCDVDEYWSYNYIYTNNGGYRMFYDLKRQLFYYSWSAN